MARTLASISLLTALFCAPLAAQETDLNSLPNLDYFKYHLKTISSDAFGGRKPMTEYETKTIEYIKDEYVRLGLQPAYADGYYQEVPEITTRTTIRDGRFTVKCKKGKVTVNPADEVVVWTSRNTDCVNLKDVQLVFAGYGISAPEYNWDDFEDVDVKGKVLVVLENDPGVYDPTVFNGKCMTYYGRHEKKFTEAFAHGAAGCLVVHEPATATYTFAAIQGAHGADEVSLLDENGNKDALGFGGWIEETAARRIFTAAGLDFDTLAEKARKTDFKAIPLNAKLTTTLDIKARTGKSHNVVGVIPGSDPALKDECVVVAAHWDHLGIGVPVDGDAIYNGAGDNASGVAGMLLHIRNFLAEKTTFKRTVFFVALTSEEAGLLGSEWYATHPVFPAAKTAAMVNIDGGAPLGKSYDISVFGGGLSSDVDEIIRVLGAAQGRRVDIVDPDLHGIFFRTDLYNFLKVGVPGLYVCGGGDFVDPEDHRNHYNPPYHHPKDEWRENWDMSGVMDHWNLIHSLIEAYADVPELPKWNPGAQFSRPTE